jgi:NAD(P)-dependent dehydrogenase (short-subunit alcohol dehydrogenase family)
MPQPISHKVWFITGASKGFGYVWTEAALARGDRVAAAARNGFHQMDEHFRTTPFERNLPVLNRRRAGERAFQSSRSQ